jgi:hypothetical protein
MSGYLHRLYCENDVQTGGPQCPASAAIALEPDNSWWLDLECIPHTLDYLRTKRVRAIQMLASYMKGLQ